MSVGLATKYFRKNSGDVQVSHLHSSWFKENIVHDQRFERRRKQGPSERSSDVCQMEVIMPYPGVPDRPKKRPYRQSDCRICNTELCDWSEVASVPGECYHLYHNQCLQYWMSRYSNQGCPRCFMEKKRQFVPPQLPSPIPPSLLPKLLQPTLEPTPELENDKESHNNSLSTSETPSLSNISTAAVLSDKGGAV